MPQPSLSDTAFNATTIAEAIAQYVGDQNTTLGTIITNLANNYAQLQTDIETNLKADSTFITNIASQVQGGGAMKFVGLGKVAINTSGTEGTDYPSSGKTWIVNVTNASYESSSLVGIGMGQPVLMLSRNQSGDWLQDNGTYSSSTSTTWISRQMSPDSSGATYDFAVSDAFTAEVAQEGLVGNTTGSGTIHHALPCFTYEVDTVS
jgi:hypothetical protein